MVITLMKTNEWTKGFEAPVETMNCGCVMR